MIFKTNYKIKIPVFFFIISLGFLILYILTDHQIFNKQQKKLSIVNMEKELNKTEKIFLDTLKDSEQLIYAVNSNQLFKDYLQNKEGSRENLEYLFENVISSNRSIMQLRFINDKGREDIRYDRYSFDTKDYYKEDKLQDKSKRYYFKQSMKEQETLLYSALDLNIENEKIETRFKPTYRIIKPVKSDNEFKGILIVNLFASSLFEHLFNSPFYNFMLLDEKGYIIQHHDKRYNWSKYRDIPFKAQKRYLKLLGKNHYKDGTIAAKQLDLPFTNKLTLVYESSFDYTKKERQIYKSRILTTFSIFIGLIFMLSFILYLILERLEKQNLHIEDLNKKKTEQKNILIQNSKMAAMGEMIANIAHQWRQPLSIISLHLANLQIKIAKGKVTNEFLEQFIEKISKNIDNMNHTIEDFSNFFKPNRPKEEFEINSLIKESLQIIEKPLRDNDITVSFDPVKDMFFTGYKNNLLQVLINIINNSKDAIGMNNIKDGKISIKTYQKEDTFIINISDNGGGIPEDILNRVFEPYFTTKFKSEGTGIGLYMCKTIIEESLHGSIRLKNINNGILCTIKLNME